MKICPRCQYHNLNTKNKCESCSYPIHKADVTKKAPGHNKELLVECSEEELLEYKKWRKTCSVWSYMSLAITILMLFSVILGLNGIEKASSLLDILMSITFIAGAAFLIFASIPACVILLMRTPKFVRLNNERRKQHEKKAWDSMQISRTIVKTVIVGSDSRKSAASSITRGFVGGALLGPLGLIGGAVSGKNKNSTTFLVIYSDGRKTTETVSNKSMRFDALIKYLEA